MLDSVDSSSRLGDEFPIRFINDGWYQLIDLRSSGYE